MTKRTFHFDPAAREVASASRAAPPKLESQPPNANTAASAQPSFSSSSDGTLTPDSQQSELIRMADAMSALTQGCLRQISTDADSVHEPILQCVQIKPMNSQQGAERYRVVMNDSVNFMQGMLGQREYSSSVCVREKLVEADTRCKQSSTTSSTATRLGRDVSAG